MKLRSQENTLHDIEDKIMDAYQTSKDLNDLVHAVEEMGTDELMTTLMGINELHNIRMGNLMRVLEQNMQRERKYYVETHLQTSQRADPKPF